MGARKMQVLFALGLGLLALLVVVGAVGAMGEGTPAVPSGRDVGPMGSLAEGLVGHWSFDEGSGTTATDASGLDNHGTLTPTVGGPVYTTTAPSLSVANPYALEFDDIDEDWVEVNGVADDVPVGKVPWSASLWVKAPYTDTSEQDALLAVNPSGGGNVVILFLRNHAFSVYDGVDTAYEGYSTTPIDDDRWHHLAYTSDGSEGTLYVDGWAEITHTVDYAFAADDRWSLGQEWDTNPSDFYTGLMDEVRVYTRTLGAWEVEMLAGWSHIPITYYVDADATTGAGSGLSWSDAFTEVQSALAVAHPGDQVWVAEGVYYPDYSPGLGVYSGWVSATFALRRGVALYGGFDPGSGVETPDRRDPATYVTVLSGDLGRDDTEDPHGVVTDTANIAGDNAWTVVTVRAVTETAVLDGFAVTAGDANGTSADCWWDEPCRNGGGMYNDASNPTLTDVTFSGNAANNNGGGMYNDGGSPTLTDVTFSGNTAKDGGGMVNEVSSPTLTGVTFSGNAANGDGGGMCNIDSSPALSDVTFSGNSASYGGGMGNSEGSSPTLTDVTFSGNTADYDGGGMYNFLDSSPALTNVTFSGNTANAHGGGMFNVESSVTLTHCTVTSNTADLDGDEDGGGGGIYQEGSGSVHVKNTIVAGNGLGAGSTASGPDLLGTFSSLGYNLIGNADDATFVPATGDQVGSGAAPLDPLLADLALNPPGSTATHALLEGSPARDWIPYGVNGCGSEVTADQRGVARPQPAGGACDVGAYEAPWYVIYLPLVVREYP